MSTIYTYSGEDLTQLANQVKDVLMEATGHTDLEDYIVTIGKASMFRRFAQKWLGYDPKDKTSDEGLRIIVTKAVITAKPPLKVIK